MTPTSKPKVKLAKKLLVVEDEGQIGLVLNMILSDRNFDLDYVNNLLDAQEYLEKITLRLLFWITSFLTDSELILSATSRKNILLSRSS
jgi:DNA-binding NtrC family response regulator